MTLGPSIEGFKSCIRLVVAVDGTFLKCKHQGAPSSSLTFRLTVNAFDLQPSGSRLRPSAVTTSSISRGGIYSRRGRFLQLSSSSFSLGDFGLGFWSIDTGGA
ncbi:hypothetical protein LWI28_014509 [Acer negundo]|uniref:Uncharacterized protein n=1 Tax=Acer negundo TaxID=4023 RepID=A0AAD5J0J5_ACENE|nr:hypothetical protein LWI28_014509 [Acer negundo]